MGGQQSLETAPGTMRRLIIKQANTDMTQVELAVEEVPLPVPKSGEVLIKVVATPVNPSDYGEWTSEKTKPGKAIGKEGSGVVVASGGGWTANGLVGKRVGFVNVGRGQGSYSEYVTVDAMRGAFVLPEEIATEDAASHFVNPYTAAGFIATVRERHFDPEAGMFGGTAKPGMIHTAAASQLGQMLVKLCKKEGVNLINLVRREEQAETLRAIGAEHVLVTQGDTWQSELAALIESLGVQIAFDAVAGDMTGILLDSLPPKGTCFVYGRLSNQGASGIQPLDLIYRNKKLEGFFLTSWIMQGGMWAAFNRIRTATSLVHGGLRPDGWSSSTFTDCTLEEMPGSFMQMWKDGFTGHKLRIRFKD